MADIIESCSETEEELKIQDLVFSGEDLFLAIIAERDRIFGKYGAQATFEEYEWLEKNYGVTYIDDSLWLDVMDYASTHELADEPETEEVIKLFSSPENVEQYMARLLIRYRSSTVKCPIPSQPKDSTLDSYYAELYIERRNANLERGYKPRGKVA